MAAVDLQLELETLRNDDPYAGLGGQSLEERLEAELMVGMRHDEAPEDAPDDAPGAGEPSTREASLDRAAIDVERTCGEIAEEARTELLVQRMVEARNRLAASLSASSPPGREEPQGSDTATSAPGRKAGSGTILSAFAARRLALACSVCAVALAGGIFLKARTDPGFALQITRILPAQESPVRQAGRADQPDGPSIAATAPPASAAMPEPVKATMAVPALPARPAAIVTGAGGKNGTAQGDWRNGLSARMNGSADRAPSSDSDSAEIALLETRLKQLQAHAAKLQQSVDDAYGDELPKLKAEIEAGRGEIALLKQKIAELETARVPATPAPEAAPTAAAADVPSAPVAQPVTEPDAAPVLAYAGRDTGAPAAARIETISPTLMPRDSARVETALAASLGLENLDAGERATLKERLVRGECLSTALSAVFEHVPVLAMRDLVRRLDGAC